MKVESEGCKVAYFTARLEIDSPEEQSALLEGANVSATHISPCAMEILVGESKHVVAYPYPIHGPSSRVRIARKSHYIEVCLCTSQSIRSLSDIDLPRRL